MYPIVTKSPHSVAFRAMPPSLVSNLKLGFKKKVLKMMIFASSQISLSHVHVGSGFIQSPPEGQNIGIQCTRSPDPSS